MSRKKWGKTAARREKIIREAIPKPDTTEEIDAYISKARSVTVYELAHRFGIRLSTARKILREKEAQGVVVPYVREGGFVAYTTPDELKRKEVDFPVILSDVLETVASSIPSEPVITEEIEAGLAMAAAETMQAVKPSKLLRRRREAGERKEKARDKRPEVVVEPLEEGGEAKAVETPSRKKATKKAEEKEEAAEEKKTKKKAAKKAEKKEEAAEEEKKATKKKTTKKKAEKKEEAAEEEKKATKKKTTKKKTEEKEEAVEEEKKTTKKKTEKKEEAAEEEKKTTKKKTTKKKAEEKKEAAEEEKATKKKATKKKKSEE